MRLRRRSLQHDRLLSSILCVSESFDLVDLGDTDHLTIWPMPIASEYSLSC